MNEEKKSITITITDLDDDEKITSAINRLFATVIYHLADSDIDGIRCEKFIGGCYIYFRKLLEISGYTKEDLDEL